MTSLEQEIESAQFRRLVARSAWHRARRALISRRLGYCLGRPRHYLRLLTLLCKSLSW
jgi:hypothetical protein